MAEEYDGISPNSEEGRKILLRGIARAAKGIKNGQRLIALHELAIDQYMADRAEQATQEAQ